MQPRILLPLAAAAFVFAAPAAANAAVTPSLNGTQLTLTSDGAADNITLGVNADNEITHNLGTANGLASNTDFDPDPNNASAPLPSDGSITVTVNAGDGNDTVNLSAPNLADSVINGEGGDDIITGSDNPDAIDGGAGNDRITGFRGGDTINGGDGNDVMIWNNGDGNDINTGGNGNDETLITAGTADDNMVVAPNGGFTRFERVNAPFTVDMETVEKLSITSFSGNDTLNTDPTVTLPINIDAGSGDDNITTGAGADLISAGDGNDILNGAGGGDRLVGDRGGDTMNGGPGDDTMVWNNGDGSDVMNGDDGVDRVETNLSAAADTSTLTVENGRIRYDRLNPGPFNLSIATAEVFELNTLGGDDTLTTAPGVGIPLVVDGGAGNDTLEGGDADDTIDGGDGDDVLTLRDRGTDFARGGPGADRAVVDAADAVAADVETVERPAAQPGPGAGTLPKGATVRRNVASLRVSCPAGVSGCEGTITLTAIKKVGNVKARARLGRARYSLQAGETKTVRVRVSSKARKIAKRKRLVVNARVTSEAGAAKTSKLTLRFR